MKLLLVWAVITVIAVNARTAVKQQPIAPRITSLTDKDARQKASVHPAFANAGKRAGLELWRIENFEPVAVPQADVGKFYKGDSYVVLKTTADKRNNLSWDIHYWIGSESTQDESGAAAILTVGLDDKFDGKAVQHRESMGYESSQFLNYFTGGAVRYLDGGHQSGFNHVVTNPGAEKRLFQVKGKKNIRVRQVDPLISSMNKGDCFILDINNDIFLYVGEKAKNVERLKAISMANQIRDQDHNGRGRVEIIDQYSSDVDVQKFFTNLGSGSRDLVPEESAGGDDQTFEKNEERSVVLSEVSDSSGKLKITPLTAPFRQEQLKPQETYILDTVSGSIYVWVGKQATQKEKTEAMSKAEQYLTAKKYPSWVHVARIPQGTEPAIFKQYFSTWRDAGMSHSRLVRSLGGISQRSEDSEYYLFEIKTGSPIQLKEIPDFRQADMTEDGIYYLIHGTKQAFFWIGKNTGIDYKKWKQNIDNIKPIVDPKNELEIVVLKQGLETEAFKGAFRKWDPYMWMNIERVVLPQEDVGKHNEGSNIEFKTAADENHDQSRDNHYGIGSENTQDESGVADSQTEGLDKFDSENTQGESDVGDIQTHDKETFDENTQGESGAAAIETEGQDEFDSKLVQYKGELGSETSEYPNHLPGEDDTTNASLTSGLIFELEKGSLMITYKTFGGDQSGETPQGSFPMFGVDKDAYAAKHIEQEGDPSNSPEGTSNSHEQTGEIQPKSEFPEYNLFELKRGSPEDSFAIQLKEIPNFRQEDMTEEGVFYLIHGNKQAFFWIGKNSRIGFERTKHCLEIMKPMIDPNNEIDVSILKQGWEPKIFKDAFTNWDPDMWMKRNAYETAIEAQTNNEIDTDN